jgi:type VI secretion system secreted protein Hcp
MSGYMFLKLTKIHGESLDAEHEHEIEVEGWKWGLSNKAPFQMKDENAATPHTNFQHLTIDKYFDHASLTLARHCAHGRHIPEAVLSCRKHTASTDKAHNHQDDTFLTIKLTNAKVEKIDWPGGKMEGSGPFQETITLSFLEVNAEYKMQRQDGSLHGANHFHFNVADPDKQESAGV